MVRTALIGLGYWGPNLLRNFVAQKTCDMIYVCDRKAERREWGKSRYPHVQFIEDPAVIFADPTIDLVLIATPTSTHSELALGALRSNKHVFIEKPLCGTSREGESLVAEASKRQRHIFVDHTFAFAPSVMEMKKRFERGDLGELLYFDSTRINLGIIQPDTNVLWDLAVHDLTILSQLKPLSQVQEVSAHGMKHYGNQVEVAHLHLQFTDGVTAHIHVSWLSPVKMRQTIVAGTKAMMTYDDIEPSEKLRVYDRGVVRDLEAPNPLLPKYRVGDISIPALNGHETLDLAASEVLDCVMHNKPPRVSGAAGLEILKILEAADLSLQSKASVLLA